MMDALNELARPAAVSRSWWKTVVVLFKLRVVSLLLLAAFGGAALGSLVVETVSGWQWLLLAVTGALSAGGASAMNQYLERERDGRMRRTAQRPLANGQIANPAPVLLAAVGMVLLASGLAWLAGNPALAFWELLGAAIYVGVYTIWLKPRTRLNIVIGGAAGSCAVLSGGAAVGAWQAWGVWLLAALVFVWTPVHFWALALAYRHDYVAADYPMLPARVPPATAVRWTALHTVLTAVFGLALGFWPQVNGWYLLLIGLATAVLVHRTRRLWQSPTDRKAAFALFHHTNLYLTLVLLILILASIWR